MSTLCHDCGIDAWDQAEDGQRVHEDFYVHNELWDRVVPDDHCVAVPGISGCREGSFVLCLGCFEQRLGREVTKEDLRGRLIDLFGTPPSKRLIARWGEGATVGSLLDSLKAHG